MFQVGQKVVCVDDKPSGNRIYNEVYPKKGGIYTIRGIYWFEPTKEPGVRLVEIVNQPFKYAGGVTECGFRPSRFRPLIERKTDISVFQALLNPANHKKLENA